MNVVILMGPSGAGKSTFVKRTQPKQYHDRVICSADNYPGLYDGDNNIDFSKLGAAHAHCKQMFMTTLQEMVLGRSGLSVLVDNTNTQIKHIAEYMEPALAAGFTPMVIVVDPPLSNEELALRNAHNVPVATIARMRDQIKHTLDNWPGGWPKPIHMKE